MKTEVKRAIVLIIAVVLVVVGIKIFQNRDTTLKDLQNKGYTENEINILLNTLSKEEIKNVIESEYNGDLPKFLDSKYYIHDNLQKYLDFCKDENNSRKFSNTCNSKNIADIISIINTNAYIEWYTNTKEVTNLSNTMLVNKHNYLPADYAPSDIQNIRTMYAYDGHSIKEEVYDQFIKMWSSANKEGLSLIINSSYRTFEDQERIYAINSDDYASKPGFSEHQTGLALDIVTPGSIGNDFENTEEFKWLKNNAHKYGFILRYPKEKEHITGYSYESWHYRYLGIDLATKVYNSNLSYEEYYAYYCEYKGEC